MKKLSKKFMLNYLSSLNVFQKKQVLLRVIEKNLNYTDEEKKDLIFKIDKMTANEVEEVIKGLVEFYG